MHRIAGNFCEAEIFAIFAIKQQLDRKMTYLSKKHQANCGNFSQPMINLSVVNCEQILVLAPSDSHQHALVSVVTS